MLEAERAALPPRRTTTMRRASQASRPLQTDRAASSKRLLLGGVSFGAQRIGYLRMPSLLRPFCRRSIEARVSDDEARTASEEEVGRTPVAVDGCPVEGRSPEDTLRVDCCPAVQQELNDLWASSDVTLLHSDRRSESPVASGYFAGFRRAGTDSTSR